MKPKWTIMLKFPIPFNTFVKKSLVSPQAFFAVQYDIVKVSFV